MKYKVLKKGINVRQKLDSVNGRRVNEVRLSSVLRSFQVLLQQFSFSTCMTIKNVTMTFQNYNATINKVLRTL